MAMSTGVDPTSRRVSRKELTECQYTLTDLKLLLSVDRMNIIGKLFDINRTIAYCCPLGRAGTNEAIKNQNFKNQNQDSNLIGPNQATKAWTNTVQLFF